MFSIYVYPLCFKKFKFSQIFELVSTASVTRYALFENVPIAHCIASCYGDYEKFLPSQVNKVYENRHDKKKMKKTTTEEEEEEQQARSCRWKSETNSSSQVNAALKST